MVSVVAVCAFVVVVFVLVLVLVEAVEAWAFYVYVAFAVVQPHGIHFHRNHYTHRNDRVAASHNNHHAVEAANAGAAQMGILQTLTTRDIFGCALFSMRSPPLSDPFLPLQIYAALSITRLPRSYWE